MIMSLIRPTMFDVAVRRPSSPGRRSASSRPRRWPPGRGRVVPSSRASRCSRACRTRRRCPRGTIVPVAGSMILISTCGRTRPTVPTRRSSGSSRPRDRRERRRFGHAVADGHLGHVQPGDDLLHQFDRARRAGHDAGAQRRAVELARNARMLEHGDGTSSARRTARCSARPGRSPARPAGRSIRPGTTMQAPCAGAGEVAQHHAEAVVERHRNADAVGARCSRSARPVK